MDHRGLRARLTGAGCTSCGAAVSIDRISVLADRGDLAFVELGCAACGSRTMSLVLRDGSAAGQPVLDTAVHPELGPSVDARTAGRPVIDEDDVRAVARLLAGWDGDLRTLLESRDDAPPEPAV
jgi:hypothetical protein